MDAESEHGDLPRMTKNLLFTSKNVGEAFAGQALAEHFGAEVFIGPSIEMKLQELASVVYHEVPDSNYYGATISYSSEKTYIALNTFHPLRIRYFTAAHELWHVLGLDKIGGNIDLEKAAERFAAALMMPESLIRLLWGRLSKNSSVEQIVFMLADMASTPYRATAKRLIELNLLRPSKHPDLVEEDWTALRKKLNLPPSPLDMPLSIVQFNRYEQNIERALESGLTDRLSAASKLTNFSPEKAAEYQSHIVQGIQNESGGTEE